MNRDAYPEEYYQEKYPSNILGPMHRALIRLMLERCGRRSSLLEIGCARGPFLAAVEPFFQELVGLDVSEYAIEQSRKYLPKAKTYLCDVQETDQLRDIIGERTFDAIVSLHTFEHFDDPAGVLGACYDLLRDDGHFFLVVPNPDSLMTKVYGLLGRRESCKVFADSTHKCALHRRQWESLIRQAGFTWEFKGTPFFVTNTEFLARLYPFYYSSFLGGTGFELLFICRRA